MQILLSELFPLILLKSATSGIYHLSLPCFPILQRCCTKMVSFPSGLTEPHQENVQLILHHFVTFAAFAYF